MSREKNEHTRAEAVKVHPASVIKEHSHEATEI